VAKIAKNQEGFHHIVLLLIIVIVAAVGLAGYRVFKASGPKTASSVTSKTGCPKDLSGVFTKSIVDPEKILALRPLGYTDGTEHILPVDHTGFSFPNDSKLDSVPVYAPAKITITSISSHIDYAAGGKPFTNAPNFMYDFSVCPGLTGWLEFIHVLPPNIKTIWDSGEKQHNEGQLNSGAKAVNEYLKTNLTINAGDIIGYTSAQPSIALSIFDKRSKRTDVDFSYYNDSDRRAYAICFTDLYATDLKNTLDAKYGYYEDRQGLTPGFTPRVVEPKCGQTIQNISGSIQGDWFANRPKKDENLESEGKTISFIHNNYDPSFAQISIGGNIVPSPQTFAFKPSPAGSVGREFSKTQAGETYCYKNDPARPGFIFAPTNNDSRVLVKLLDEHHLKIEVQTGDCGNSPEFMKAIIYER